MDLVSLGEGGGEDRCESLVPLTFRVGKVFCFAKEGVVGPGVPWSPLKDLDRPRFPPILGSSRPLSESLGPVGVESQHRVLTPHR